MSKAKQVRKGVSGLPDLRAMARSAGPNDPIYRSGLSINAVRALRPDSSSAGTEANHRDDPWWKTSDSGLDGLGCPIPIEDYHLEMPPEVLARLTPEQRDAIAREREAFEKDLARRSRRLRSK